VRLRGSYLIGCRVSELARLRWCDAEAIEGVVQVRLLGKGSKARTVRISADILTLLETPGRNAADAWLLPSPRTAGHLTRQATADRMRRWGQQAGVHLHPHRLRHNMKRKGSCAASIFSRCRRRSGIATAVLPPGLCGRQSSRQQQLAAGLTCYLELAATPSKNERHIKLLRSLTAQEGNAFGSHDSCC
jgi:hypothetical protein